MGDHMDRKVHFIFNLKYRTPKLWERIILAFCPMHSTENDITFVQYKYFWDRLYIYTQEPKTKTVASGQENVIWTGGVEKPWTN